MSLGLADLVVGIAVAALLGVAAWFALRRLRRPALAHALFVLALLKLLVPPILPVPLPDALRPDALLGLDGAAAHAPRADDHADASTVSERPPSGQVGPDASTVSTAAGVPASSAAAPAATTSTSGSGGAAASPLAWILLATWIGGSLLVAGLALRRARRFARAVRATRATPPPAWLARELRALLPRFALAREPQLTVVDADVAPAVLATLRGTALLLPSRALDLPAPALRALLAHELAHVRRRDPWVRWLELATAIAWWWLPVVWWLRLGLREAEERACDAWVAAVLPDARVDYCRVLLQFASEDAAVAAPAHASPTRRLRTWKHRLEDIMTRDIPHRLSRPARLATLLAAVAVLPLALPGARAQRPGTQPTVPQRLAAEVAIAFDDAVLDDWTKALSSRLGVPFTIEASARTLAADRTTLRGLRLPAMTGRRALDVIAAITDLRWSATDVAVVLSGPPVDTVEIDTGAGVCHVFGATKQRGAVPLPADATVLQLMTTAGWNGDADLEHVSMIRPAETEPLTVEIDVLTMIKTGDTRYNVRLRPGDILFVPSRNGRRDEDDLPPERAQVGTRVQFVLYLDPLPKGAEELRLLRGPQTIGRDGTLLVPYVGHVDVLGKTKQEIGDLVQGKLQPLFAGDIRLHALFVPRDRR